jgi:hypothetical protein
MGAFVRGLHGRPTLVLPELRKPIRCQGGIPRRRLQIPVSKIMRERPCVMPVIGELIAGRMSQRFRRAPFRSAKICEQARDALGQCYPLFLDGRIIVSASGCKLTLMPAAPSRNPRPAKRASGLPAGSFSWSKASGSWFFRSGEAVRKGGPCSIPRGDHHHQIPIAGLAVRGFVQQGFCNAA